MKLLAVGLLLALTLGCGYGSNYNPSSTTTSASVNVADLVPADATAGGQGFTMTVNGSGFGSDSTLYFNSVAHSVTYISAGQLMTDISADDIASAGTMPVYVRTGGKNSNTVNFQVK